MRYECEYNYCCFIIAFFIILKQFCLIKCWKKDKSHTEEQAFTERSSVSLTAHPLFSPKSNPASRKAAQQKPHLILYWSILSAVSLEGGVFLVWMCVSVLCLSCVQLDPSAFFFLLLLWLYGQSPLCGLTDSLNKHSEYVKDVYKKFLIL